MVYTSEMKLLSWYLNNVKRTKTISSWPICLHNLAPVILIENEYAVSEFPIAFIDDTEMSTTKVQQHSISRNHVYNVQDKSTREWRTLGRTREEPWEAFHASKTRPTDTYNSDWHIHRVVAVWWWLKVTSIKKHTVNIIKLF